MIKFLFCGNINSNDKFFISIDGATNIISSECRAIEFELSEKKICEIRIEKQLSKSEITWKNITLDLLTIVLRGMAVLLFMDVDSEWFRNVQPYSIIAVTQTHLNGDEEFSFGYCKSKFTRRYIWTYPRISIYPKTELKNYYVVDTYNIKNEFYRYARKFISLSANVIIILLMMALRLTQENKNTTVIYFLILIIMLINILVFYNEKRRCNKIINFLLHNH